MRNEIENVNCRRKKIEKGAIYRSIIPSYFSFVTLRFSKTFFLMMLFESSCDAQDFEPSHILYHLQLLPKLFGLQASISRSVRAVDLLEGRLSSEEPKLSSLFFPWSFCLLSFFTFFELSMNCLHLSMSFERMLYCFIIS